MNLPADGGNRDTTHLSPVNWGKWRVSNRLSLENLVALSLGYDPDDMNLICTRREFIDRLQMTVLVAQDPVQSERLGLQDQPSTTLSQLTVVSFSEFVTFAKSNDWSMPAELEAMGDRTHGEEPQARHWPWGSYDTRLLGFLALTAKKMWVNYDPNDQETAPTDEQVIEWLGKVHGVGKNDAAAIARVLRADGLKPGRRRTKQVPKE